MARRVGVDGVGRREDGSRVYFAMPEAPLGSMAEVTLVRGDQIVPLPDGLDDAEYCAVLEARLPALVQNFAPDLIFYNAGVDPHRDDRLGRLCLTDAGLLARDRYVVGLAQSQRIPLCAVIGGGYGSDVDALAARHALVFEAMAAA